MKSFEIENGKLIEWDSRNKRSRVLIDLRTYRTAESIQDIYNYIDERMDTTPWVPYADEGLAINLSET